jgi:hypothetical protein
MTNYPGQLPQGSIAMTAAQRKAAQRERDRQAVCDGPGLGGYITTEGLARAAARCPQEKLPLVLVELGRRRGLIVSVSPSPTAHFLPRR